MTLMIVRADEVRPDEPRWWQPDRGTAEASLAIGRRGGTAPSESERDRRPHGWPLAIVDRPAAPDPAPLSGLDAAIAAERAMADATARILYMAANDSAPNIGFVMEPALVLANAWPALVERLRAAEAELVARRGSIGEEGRCSRCHGKAPNPVGCALCNVPRLTERVKEGAAAILWVKELEAALGEVCAHLDGVAGMLVAHGLSIPARRVQDVAAAARGVLAGKPTP